MVLRGPKLKKVLSDFQVIVEPVRCQMRPNLPGDVKESLTCPRFE